MNRFNSILIANRGEIAIRIIRSAKALGYRTIAVYSEADRGAPHTLLADEAILIGLSPAADSYLDITKIIGAAEFSGAEAIHPGYGFLSENAEFARACEAAGFVFIGPTSEAISLMGNKAAAKRRMLLANVPCVPGYEGTDQSDTTLALAAKKIGYPIMVKAAAGGGGRGMRLVNDSAELQNAIQTARSEAENSFGSDELILEKAITRPRHVEIQIFADEYGNTIHLGERDCSIQRRHQKIVEEAPCPIMTPKLRENMGAAAITAAKSIGYGGAGTVEFLLDEQEQYYFLEMNTRLQVEHPVTEMITGLDLVALQLHVAQGLKLEFSQEDIELSGHAIEVRLYAEDPSQDFLPVTGIIDLWSPPEEEGIRVDSGIASGQEISQFYDPMIAKVIASGDTRDEARRRLIKALKKTTCFGSTTNKRFLIDILETDEFAAGEVTTAFIEENFSNSDQLAFAPKVEWAALAATIQFFIESRKSCSQALSLSSELNDWSSVNLLESRYRYSFGDHDFDVSVSPKTGGVYVASILDTKTEIRIIETTETSARVRINGEQLDLSFFEPSSGLLFISLDGYSFLFKNRIADQGAGDEENAGEGRIVAPMHGTIVEIIVAIGDTVQKGTHLAVLEAMKMQHDIVAQIEGAVSNIATAEGKQIAADDVIIEIEKIPSA